MKAIIAAIVFGRLARAAKLDAAATISEQISFDEGVALERRLTPDTTAGCGPCDGVLELALVTDSYPAETSWSLALDESAPDNCEDASATSGGYADANFDYGAVVIATQICPGQAYTFELADSFGDGICCGYGSGSFSLSLNGVVLASGGDFGSSWETTSSPPTTTSAHGETTSTEARETTSLLRTGPTHPQAIKAMSSREARETTSLLCTGPILPFMEAEEKIHSSAGWAATRLQLKTASSEVRETTSYTKAASIPRYTEARALIRSSPTVSVQFSLGATAATRLRRLLTRTGIAHYCPETMETTRSSRAATAAYYKGAREATSSSSRATPTFSTEKAEMIRSPSSPATTTTSTSASPASIPKTIAAFLDLFFVGRPGHGHLLRSRRENARLEDGRQRQHHQARLHAAHRRPLRRRGRPRPRRRRRRPQAPRPRRGGDVDAAAGHGGPARGLRGAKSRAKR